MLPFSKSAQSPTAWQRAKLAVAAGAALVGYTFGTSYAADTVGGYLKLTGRSVANIAALRALDKTGNPYVFVAGYYTPGDSGGGPYYYDSSDTTSSDDGGAVIVGADGGRWKLNTTGTISIKQYGAKGDNSTDDTTAANSWLAYLYANGRGGYMPAGLYAVTDVSMTATGGRLNGCLRVWGDGPNASIFVKTAGTSTAPLTIQGATPSSGTPNSIQLHMSNIGILGSGLTKTGFVMAGIASFWIEKVTCSGFRFGFDVKSCLIGTFRDCIKTSNTFGARTRRNGTSAYCNLITWQDCIVSSNAQIGWDLGDANGIRIVGCDIEANGTTNPTATVTFSGENVTWNSHGLGAGDPVIFTSSGTLPANITSSYIYYVIDTTTNTFRVSATIGAAAISFADAGTGTHTGLSFNTGAVFIRKSCIDELGYSKIDIEGNWFEGNYGAGVYSEYAANAFGFEISIRGGHILGRDGGRNSVAIANARNVTLDRLYCVSGADIVNVSCDKLTVSNSRFITLVRPNMTAIGGRTYVYNSYYNGNDHYNGEVSSFTGTLIGVDSTVTGTVSTVVQGSNVRGTGPALSGTSNSTLLYLRGLPTAITPTGSNRPGIAWTVDAGAAAKISHFEVKTDGDIEFKNGISAAFTASGTKSIAEKFTFEYSL